MGGLTGAGRVWGRGSAGPQMRGSCWGLPGGCAVRAAALEKRTLPWRLPPRLPRASGWRTSPASPPHTHLLLHLDHAAQHADFIRRLRVRGPLVALLPGLSVPGAPAHNLVHPVGGKEPSEGSDTGHPFFLPPPQTSRLPAARGDTACTGVLRVWGAWPNGGTGHCWEGVPVS